MDETTQLTPLEASQSYDYYYDEEDNFQQNLRKNIIVFSMVIYSITFVLGVIGNGLVIFITGFRMKKTVSIVWFLNLAIADFTFTLFLPVRIAHVSLDFHWPFGEAMCKFNKTLIFINLYASAYLLMVISIDCCISVLCPVWAQNHRNPLCASFVASGVWVLSLVLSSPNIHFTKTRLYGDVIHCYTSYSHDWEQAWATHRAMIIVRFIFAFAIPLLVIIVCYGAIVQRLRRDRLARSSKPFKVITAVIMAFFVCWFPYHVFALLEIQAYQDPSLHLVLGTGIPLTSSLAYINSCLNPILCVFMWHDFKERLKRSIFSVFENAFAEEESQSTTQTKTKPSENMDSHDL